MIHALLQCIYCFTLFLACNQSAETWMALLCFLFKRQYFRKQPIGQKNHFKLIQALGKVQPALSMILGQQFVLLSRLFCPTLLTPRLSFIWLELTVNPGLQQAGVCCQLICQAAVVSADTARRTSLGQLIPMFSSKHLTSP